MNFVNHCCLYFSNKIFDKILNKNPITQSNGIDIYI